MLSRWTRSHIEQMSKYANLLVITLDVNWYDFCLSGKSRLGSTSYNTVCKLCELVVNVTFVHF